MARPVFTRAEEVVIASLRANAPSSDLATWSYLSVGIVLAVAGFVNDSIFLVLAAFCAVVLMRISELRQSHLWMPHYRTAIEKYEAACGGSADCSEPNSLISECKACGGVVSRNSAQCPHCGDPNR